jgi:hypothetical protein
VKVGDLVRWTKAEEAAQYYFGIPAMEKLTEHRKCGIIVDRNPYVFFVLWQDKELLAQKPNTIEVIK